MPTTELPEPLWAVLSALSDLPVARLQEQLDAIDQDEQQDSYAKLLRPLLIEMQMDVAKPDSSQLISMVQQFIRDNLHRQSLKLEDAAEALDMSARTLQRRLQDEQLNFVLLRDRIKRRHCLHMILDQKLDSRAIAEKLGFADVSGFHHAFQRWTGMTPKAVRRTLYCRRQQAI